jgi:hypothetical protein
MIGKTAFWGVLGIWDSSKANSSGRRLEGFLDKAQLLDGNDWNFWAVFYMGSDGTIFPFCFDCSKTAAA